MSCVAAAVPPTVYNLKNVTQAEGRQVPLVCLSYGDPAPIMAFQKTNNSEPYQMGENVSICCAVSCMHRREIICISELLLIS